MAELMPAGDLPRVPGWKGPADYKRIVHRYGQLADHPYNPRQLVRRMSADLLAGTTVWRSPELHYNIGTAANSVAAAMYAIALDVNVFLISDGQAGNAVLAEHALSAIMADLAGLPSEQSHGLFTFGGTGTIAYAIKAGIRKAAPESVQHGVPEDVHIMITEDSHFSHMAAADWLGLGTDRLITAPASGPERRTNLAAAEQLLRHHLDRGARIAAIIINGGTTYDHVVDDIEGFAAMRDKLAADHQLDYRPHLHVDSVIGWGWLMLTPQDIACDVLGVPASTVNLLARQYQRISGIRYADSWGSTSTRASAGARSIAAS